MPASLNRERPAPALSRKVQEITNFAAQAGLCPLIGDIDPDVPEFEVAFLPDATSDPARQAEWILVVDATDQDADLALYGPPTVPGGDGMVWFGADRILQVVEGLAYERAFAVQDVLPAPR
jgi:hypothetical protein